MEKIRIGYLFSAESNAILQRFQQNIKFFVRFLPGLGLFHLFMLHDHMK